MNLVFDWAWLQPLGRGFLVTFELTAVAISIGFVIGILLAVGRVYGNRLIRLLSTVYLTLFRGTPLLIQIFIIYFGLPSLGIMISAFVSAIVALGLNSGAYQAEYFRGSIQAVKNNEIVAARALGMSKLQAIRYVVLPQTLRMVIPSWSNQLINLLKFSSLVYLIRVQELMYEAKIIAGLTFRNFEVFTIVAIMYLTTALILSRILGMIEKKVRIPGLGGKGTQAA
jgi:polar amino acid transport system permease protein